VEKDHITSISQRAELPGDRQAHGEDRLGELRPADKILHGQWSSPSYIDAAAGLKSLPGGDGWLRGMDPLTGKILWKFDMNPKDSVWLLGGKGTRNNIIAHPFAREAHLPRVGQDPEHGEGVGNFYAIDPRGRRHHRDGKVWHVEDDFHRTIASAAVTMGWCTPRT